MDQARLDIAREAVFRHARKIEAAGLVVASAGNVSARVPECDAIAITPTSIPYESMTVDQISVVSLATGRPLGSGESPSSEVPLHLAIYRRRADVGAIVHTHSPCVSALSVMRRPLRPIIDEMVVYFGGTVEVAEYAFTGTAKLGENVVRALGDRAGVLLSNHGNVCVGGDLAEAFQVALTMESTARIYLHCLEAGGARALPEDSLRLGRALYDRLREKRRDGSLR